MYMRLACTERDSSGNKKCRQKKWATEVALNALRARVPGRSARLALVRVLPDENAQTGKEGDHQPDRYHTGDNHVVEEHAGLPIRLPLSLSLIHI